MNGLRSVPRAPGWLPGLGHALPLWRHPLPYLKSLKSSGEMVRIDLGSLPVYFVTTAELIHELLVAQGRHFDKGRFFDRARILVGNGIATSSGDVHRRHRRLMQPMFHRDRIADYIGIMAKHSRAMTQRWQADQTVAVDKALYEYALATLAETMFSTQISQSAIEEVRRDILILIKNALIRAASPTILDRLPITANRRFDAASARLRQVIDDVIATARDAGNPHGPDLLSTLLSTRDADTGESLTDMETRDELVTILFAGTETTASMLSWAYHEIAHHPEVEEKLLSEIDSITGSGILRPEHLPDLTSTNRVLNEVTRLHAVPMLMRRAIQTVQIGGMKIPPGTEMGFSIYALHQDPDIYPDPGCFYPDRWLPERAVDIPRSGFIPFGAGTRKCIADTYAWTAMTVNVATTLAHWKLSPAPGHTVQEVAAAVAHPDALPMTPTPRRKY